MKYQVLIDATKICMNKYLYYWERVRIRNIKDDIIIIENNDLSTAFCDLLTTYIIFLTISVTVATTDRYIFETEIDKKLYKEFYFMRKIK